MAFNFGSSPFGTSTTTASNFGFGSSAAKPGGGTAAGGFGTSGGGFSFGGSTTSAPTFNLGATTTTTNTGFSLGGLSTSSTFGGFGSGLNTTSGGQQATQPQQQQANTGFGSFGGGSLFGGSGTTTTSAAPTMGFNFSGFGQSTATTTSAPASFLSSFGGGQPQQSTPGFGSFGKQLGTTPSTQVSGFGGFGFGGTNQQFGGGNTGGLVGSFGQSQQQQQQMMQQQQQQQQMGMFAGLDPIYNSVFNVCMFGDERDEVLSKWNLLQACWGTGKGFYAPNVPPVDYTPQNPLCRFKSIAYNIKPTSDGKDGIVGIHFNRKEEDIRSQETQLITSLNSVLGNKPHLVVNIDSIRSVSDNTALVFIYVEEKAPNGVSRRINNNELCQYLVGVTPKQQLTSMGAIDLFPHSPLDKETLQQYLDTPPNGIEVGVWKQAQLDNPDVERLIPVGVIGFNELRWRANCRNMENKKHQLLIDKLAEEIANLERDNQSTKAKIMECRQAMVQFEHRLLKILVKQEVTRNVGVALRPDEEELRSRLDTIHSQLNSPQIKGRLNELLSQIRMHKQEVSQQDFESYSMTPSVLEELKQFLAMQQSGIKALLEILQTDLDDMKIIKEDMVKLFANAQPTM